MQRSILRPLAGVVSVVAAAACGSSSQYQAAGGSVNLATPAPAPLGSRELQLLREMSDANIVGHLATVDSIEVATADSALRFSKSDIVTDYARSMKAAHANDFVREHDLAARLGLVPTVDVSELGASHLAASLDSVRIASDLTIDRHYTMSQVQLHRHLLAELQTLQSVARNPAIREHIAELIPVVQDHLARAHAIAVKKGFEKKRATG